MAVTWYSWITWKIRMKTNPSKTKSFIWMFIPITHSILYHYRKEEFFAKQKSLRVLKFLRVLFRFHSDRVLLMDFSGRVLLIVLSDGVLFESLVIGSSSLTNRFFSWVISALFPAYRFFYQNVLLLFDLKQMFCLHYIFKHKFTLNNQ